jgi:hypothetical protein
VGGVRTVCLKWGSVPEELAMDTKMMWELIAAGIFLVLYLAKRRARLKREE